MKVVIIGAVAAGPKAAARIKRLMPTAEVTVIEKANFISYAGCGLPYYISGLVHEQKELMATGAGVLRDPNFFLNAKDITILNRTEALAIDRSSKHVRIRKADGQEENIPYNKLVIASGAKSVRPPLPGIDLEGIYTVQTVDDAEKIKAQLAGRSPGHAVITGGGLIGMEMVESLCEKGWKVTVVELMDQILTILDKDMAFLAQKYLESKGVKILTSTKVLGFKGEKAVSVTETEKGEIASELVIVSVGVRPEVKLAKEAGIEIGETGGIKVSDTMQTSDPDIYAAGDCAEKLNLLTGKACLIPMGSTANKEGRVAADNICGRKDSFPGVIGSCVCKIFDYNVARTGLTEPQPLKAGFVPVSALVPMPDKAHFMPSAKPLILKLTADRKTGRLIGAQAIGPGEADKRINTAATAITAKMTVAETADIDLCYAPPYSPAVDNLLTAANVLGNILDGFYEPISAETVHEKMIKGEDFQLVDVRTPDEYKQLRIMPSIHIPLGKFRKSLGELDRNKEIIIFCKTSLRAYEAALVLQDAGFKKVKVMQGGISTWPYEKISG